MTIATDRKPTEALAQAMMPEMEGEESPLAKQIKETFQAHTVRDGQRAHERWVHGVDSPHPP